MAQKKISKKVASKKTPSQTTKKSTTKKTASKKTASKKTASVKSSGAARKPAAVTLGSVVKAFSAPATTGKTIRLADLKGKVVVLYFYPKDNTPGCTLEGNDFRRLYSKFKEAGCEIIGVSKDSMKSHESFKSKCGFPFELLSDEDEAVCRQFGVIQMKKLYGREFEGIERSTFVIDREGRLVKEWRKVRVDGHADEVLSFVQSL